MNGGDKVKKYIEVSDHKTNSPGNANIIVDESFYNIMKFYNEDLRKSTQANEYFFLARTGTKMDCSLVLHSSKNSAHANGIKKRTSLMRKFAHTELDKEDTSDVSKLLMHKEDAARMFYDRRE